MDGIIDVSRDKKKPFMTGPKFLKHYNLLLVLAYLRKSLRILNSPLALETILKVFLWEENSILDSEKLED
ncbi:hypothetical protein DFQ06_1093 [Algibacter lectus]|uniref:Uncharacterized protein n=1 Tax=Algibacter lectus TaxID=221126 RepID=A0A4R8ME97_9FLAO|nr:hypothetical protein DFQ06_1093 [Algibacter lectus]